MAARKQPPAAPPAKPVEGRPLFQPTEQQRLTVKVMVAAGILHLTIAAVIGISAKTLRRHFKREIEVGAAEIGGQVVSSLITMAIGRQARLATNTTAAQPAILPNVVAAKWYTQAKMGWSEHIVVDQGRVSDTPVRVIVELVGEAGETREQSDSRPGVRLPDEMRKKVKLVG